MRILERTAPVDQPTRYVSALMLREFYDFIRMAIHRYDMDLEDLMIVICVASESLHDVVEEAYLSNEYGFESNVLPTAERRPVSLKHIHTVLNLSRETARRKLLRIVDKGYLLRVKEGYIFPAQEGEADYTCELRRAVANNARRFVRYVNRLG